MRAGQVEQLSLENSRLRKLMGLREQAAITGMNGQPLGGRSVVVNEARPMEARPPRTGGGFGGGGGGGGYGGGGGGGRNSY